MPVELAATLAAGLRPDSRIRMKLSGMKISDRIFDLTILLAMAVDELRWLRWSKTRDAKHRRNMPESITDRFVVRPKPERKADSFRSGAEFRAAWEQAVRVKNPPVNA